MEPAALAVLHVQHPPAKKHDTTKTLSVACGSCKMSRRGRVRLAAMGEDARTAAGGTSNTLNNESRRDGDNKCARGSSAHFIRGSRSVLSGREAAAMSFTSYVDRNRKKNPQAAL